MKSILILIALHSLLPTQPVQAEEAPQGAYYVQNGNILGCNDRQTLVNLYTDLAVNKDMDVFIETAMDYIDAGECYDIKSFYVVGIEDAPFLQNNVAMSVMATIWWNGKTLWGSKTVPVKMEGDEEF